MLLFFSPETFARLQREVKPSPDRKMIKRVTIEHYDRMTTAITFSRAILNIENISYCIKIILARFVLAVDIS